MNISKEFALPIIRRPTDDSLVLWISGESRQGNPKKIEDLSRYKNNDDIIGATWSNTPLNHSCLSFDGVDDKVIISRGASLEPSTTMTVEAWVRPDTGYGKSSPRILDKSSGGANQGYYFLISAPNGTITWAVDVSVSGLISIATDAPDIAPENVWSHLVGTYDGSNLKIYINGILKKTSANISGTIDNDITRDLLIGDNDLTTNDRNFDGLLDEIRIYNRALNSQEVMQRYENTKYLYGY